MASYVLADREPPVVVTNGATIHHRASRLPKKSRFILLVTLTSIIRATLWEFTGNLLGREFGSITQSRNDPLYVVVALWAFRAGLLYSTWVARYDYIDVGALTVLANLPYAYLAFTYYAISNKTVAAHIAIEVIAIAAPTYLLRGPAPYHRDRAPVRNRFLLESSQVQGWTIVLAIAAYVVSVFVAQKTSVLNTFLLSHFDDIPTLQNAHDETFLSLSTKLFVAGWAAHAFLFNPSIGAQRAFGEVTPIEEFDPATATLPATLKNNFWYFSKRTRTLLQQTVFAVAFTMADSVLRIRNIKDTDLVGAVGYTGFWASITVVVAAWYAWVGDTEL
ncbi:hypothetical protein K491DRAFT_436597 [Lophiostoma macrostomum CBS 122681]|uniref:Uncharacterized protein n=1 Tax=Lophiostoma macrostomum CBS 122681 TaxID=1314788 RepID=A0A6A6T4Y0_9PLEO|nr:hypothetical protein K491DRAFT_436597 [Lophiostoma macrostomum CBS 122681]